MILTTFPVPFTGCRYRRFTMGVNYPFKREYGEVVSPGHPDKLADAVADRIVAAVSGRDSSALVGVEAATALNRVFVTGRIAAREKLMALDLNAVINEVYRDAGYGRRASGVIWAPYPEEIDVDETGLIRD